MTEIIILITAIIKGDKIEKITAYNKEQNLSATGRYFVTKGKDSNTIKFSDIIIDSNGEKKPKYIKDYKVISYYNSHNNSCNNIPLTILLDEPNIRVDNKDNNKGSNNNIEKAMNIVTEYAKVHNLLEAKLSDIIKAVEKDRKEAEKKAEESLEKQIKEMQEKLEKLRNNK